MDANERPIEWSRETLSDLLTQSARMLRSEIRIERKWRHLLDVDDVLQVTFCEAFVSLPTLRSKSESDAIIWLRSIARNNLRDAIRGLTAKRRSDQRKRLAPDASDDQTAFFEMLQRVTTTPSRELADAEARTALRSAITDLPPAYAVVIQAFLSGKPPEEVALEIGRSTGAVHMLRARACEWLRAALQGHPAFVR